jgi:predicted phosphoribosyltransferase
VRRSSRAARFENREAAGRALAANLASYAHRNDVLVLGLPRGGVPVAAQVAAALDAPLDIWLVRKLGVPGHEEFAMGAIATGGIVVLDEGVVGRVGLYDTEVQDVIRRETRELERRERAYRRDRSAPVVRGKTVIVVDDGLATGATMRAVVDSLRTLAPARIVVAVPVASGEACTALARHVDECVCLLRPEAFHAVGLWYDDFTPTTDEEVIACLERFGDGGRQKPAQPDPKGVRRP